MLIRLADPIDDCLGLMDGAKDFVSRMDWATFIPTDFKEFTSAMGKIFMHPNVETVVAEENGKIVAAVGMLYQPHIFNEKLIHAEELFWWADENAPKTAALRVLKYVKERAKDRGTNILTFSKLTSSPDKVEDVYKRMGLHPRETRFSGVI